MRGGALDRLVTIQRPAMIEDPVYGPQRGGWETVAARVPAQVLDVLPSKAESTEGGLYMADQPARLRIRYMRGLTSDMHLIVHKEVDEVYEISAGPAEIGRREWLEFTIKRFSS